MIYALWVAMVLVAMLTLGFLASTVMMGMGCFFQYRESLKHKMDKNWAKEDRRMAMIFGLICLLSAGFTAGGVFALLAIGQDLVG